tara:strand:+ start:3811 stop:3984 length:174 start_codon:yes stop_codon:yes gene_type:complete
LKIKKFLKPFVLTYLFFSVAISFYPSFEFYSFKGQLVILSVSLFNGTLGLYVKKIGK